MGKDDPPFTFRQELQAQRQTSRSSNTELNEEEHREIIIQKTMHALAVSEEFTKLIVKRMEQTGNFSSQPSQSSPASSPILDNSKSQRKRKAGNIQMDTREAKRRKGNDDSVKLENGLYTNAQNLKVSVRQPRLLEGAVMRDYQLDGLEWLVALDLNGANGILADEMGLGKTLQVISLICFLVEMGVGKEAPFLVIGPLSTLSNWVAEFQKFAPKIPVILYHGSKEERAPLREGIFRIKKVEDAETHPVVITSYEMPLRDPNLSKINWRYLIIDEGHRLKNHKCHLFKELRRYHSTNRLLLTGTPLQNNMSELWSLLNFILPNVVNDMDVFKCWFNPSFLESSDGNNKIVEAEQKDKVVTTLHKILKPFLLRRVKADVGLNLPPKKEVIVFAQMTQLQRRLYSAVVDKNVYSLQGKQPDIDDPVSLEKAIRHCRKSVADREQETDLLDPSEAIDVTKVTSIRKRRSNRSSTVQNGDYKLLANGVPVNAIREEPMYLQGDNTCEISEDKLLEGIVGPDEEFVTAIRIANPVSVLRQICNHPYLASYPVLPGTKIMKVDENIVQFSGKMQILDALLTRLKKNGHKVLLFSNFTKMLDLIEDYLILREYQYTRLDGTRNLSDRQDNISKFNSDEDVFVFLISTRAGGLGINLVAADTVIIYDSDWNPQADLQAQDRCHRIGQTKPVVVYRLVVQGTVDQHMLECAEKKKQLDKLVIQHGKFKNVKEDEMVTIEELRKLLGTKDGSEVVLDTGLVYSEKELDELCHRSIIFGSQNTSDKGEFEKDALKNEELSDSHDVESCSSGASSSIDSCDSLVFGESSESGGSAEALNSIEREL